MSHEYVAFVIPGHGCRFGRVVNRFLSATCDQFWYLGVSVRGMGVYIVHPRDVVAGWSEADVMP